MKILRPASLLFFVWVMSIQSQERIIRDWGGVRIVQDKQGIHILITTGNPRRIAQTAVNQDEDSRVRRAAVEKLDDQKVLPEIAAHDPEFDVRLAALQRIGDDSLLARMDSSGSASNARA
ncbi:MAG: hypothetical protein L0312_08345, partial [Acidobacteria bacterium]|nr:hypothetical protein [Acidobacteriota bacterium]